MEMCDCSEFTVGDVHGENGLFLSEVEKFELGKDVGFGGGYECTKNLTVVSRIVSLSPRA
jgi:hypothetical protein